MKMSKKVNNKILKSSENEAKRQKNENFKPVAEIYESSSEEEDLNEESILDKVFQGYSGDSDQVVKSRAFLENFFQSGSAICLICIGTVKRVEKIWSCINCYCFFHLNCIKRWANDSIVQQKLNQEDEVGYYNNQGEFIPKKCKPVRWCCPKCRSNYNVESIPRLYECFCKKEVNPPYHPWIIPHSCGEKCEKYLEPYCGHKCLLLCHPGPCPPCPQYVSTACYCGKSKPKTVRCFNKTWNCNIKCQKLLPCGIHKCEEVCHATGKCPPCKKQSRQKCQCGSEATQKNCSELVWHCKKVCNKTYSCGLHKCRKVCHADDCGDCPLGLPRSCPCGKNKIVAPCSEAVEPCGDNCQKVLDCGIHYCSERCHKGHCSQCLAIIEKKCRCGQHTKELPCSKSFFCETKCKLIRECGKHLCNKKCCDGQCPPCDKICNKTLSCKKHKCKSVCHDGPCYPCDLKSSVKCRCGNTSIVVPCGREKKVRLPKCLLPCRIPSKCHHENPHRCHINECPPCIQKCGLKNNTTNCEHPCEARCHDAIKTEILQSKTSNIWDWNSNMFEYKKMPHPKCEIKVMVRCIGGHEIAEWPCWNSKPTSCQRLCQRVLKCTNHTCTKVCHVVPNLDDNQEQEGCISCSEACIVKRPKGCIHSCKKPCHPPPCDICSAHIKSACHCGISQVIYKCNEFYCEGTNEEELRKKQELLKSCGNRCIKNYPCGHRCIANCHSGTCPNPEQCRKKVKIYCECKNLKLEISCDKHRNGLNQLVCDNKCAQKKAIEEQLRRDEEEKLKKMEEEKNRIELELYEKKFGKKKPRERKVVERPVKRDIDIKLKVLAGIIGLLSIVLMIYIMY
ncbi:NF-X1-type zinc finger protein NFXL1 [Condylostylus longicornis]|uniref:NF-X1-type zinc finger protein NFXL1 n=1 Tax=Condylostylus longicornis TaxID=2530218 RepID=UPI00244DE3D0|nr:NF-X1-type zinc finger protein NFXL1 [Condylostylus longicornis]